MPAEVFWGLPACPCSGRHGHHSRQKGAGRPAPPRHWGAVRLRGQKDPSCRGRQRPRPAAVRPRSRRRPDVSKGLSGRRAGCGPLRRCFGSAARLRRGWGCRALTLSGRVRLRDRSWCRRCVSSAAGSRGRHTRATFRERGASAESEAWGSSFLPEGAQRCWASGAVPRSWLRSPELAGGRLLAGGSAVPWAGPWAGGACRTGCETVFGELGWGWRPLVPRAGD